MNDEILTEAESEALPSDAKEATCEPSDPQTDPQSDSQPRPSRDRPRRASRPRPFRPRRRIRLPWVRIVLALLLVAAAAGAFFGVKGLIQSGATHRGEGIFDVEGNVDDKDLTLENEGFLGYTAADFAEVILGDTSCPKRLEVFTAEVADTVTITDAGLANLVIFSKVQDVTFHGVATYVINLANINQYCFVVDNAAKTLTIHVPHATLGDLNIPASRIEFGDVERGVLAFGDIKLTPEDQAALEAAAQREMEEKLLADRVQMRADEAGKAAVRDLYAPLVARVAPDYAVAVEFMG